MRSDLCLSDWRGDVSVFSGQLRTIPEYMEQKITAEALAGVLCPKLPFVTADKAHAPYALPCKLREALLVGKTLERAKARGLPLWGYMRSASHVTEGRWIKLDLDGIGKDETRALLEKLDAEKVGYLLYSTWSHGAKPRNRLRLILFLDVALSPTEYKRASQGAALWLIGQSLDPSEGGLHQLAGVFMCSPDRKAKALRLVCIGPDRCCVSTATLLALVPEPLKSKAMRGVTVPKVRNSRIGNALRWIDANQTSTWVRVGMALKALEPEFGDDSLAHWLAFSDSAEDSAKGNNDNDRYNPLIMWGSFSPVMPAEAALGQIMAMARDSVAEVVKEELRCGVKSGKAMPAVGVEAYRYLRQHHPRTADELLINAGLRG